MSRVVSRFLRSRRPESIESRARRYLGQGRVRISRVEPSAVRAACHGERLYRVRFDRGSGWSCTCGANTGCAHLYAVMLIVRPGGDADAVDAWRFPPEGPGWPDPATRPE